MLPPTVLPLVATDAAICCHLRRLYFCNLRTRETAWQRPPGLPPATPHQVHLLFTAAPTDPR
jgi:hypothetical protein